MHNRIIGILGGMGPEATADLFREITRLTPAKCDQDHLRILIYSNPSIPDRTKAIREGTDAPLAALVETARRLESAGAGIIAMPCNTAHFFLGKLQSLVKIPILNMISLTLNALRRLPVGVQTAGLLAATGTVQSGIYSTLFEKEGVDILTPEAAVQASVHAAIQEIKSSAPLQRPRGVFEDAAADLVRRGAQAIILGCTEIPLALNADSAGFPCLNPTRILARAAVEWALGSGPEK